MHCDEYGLVVGRNEDPGDSCHRTCMWLLGELWFNGKNLEARRSGSFTVLQCFRRDHHYVRHPSKGWWSDCDRLSRDQATPLVMLMGITSKKLLFGFLLHHIKRLGFFTNTRRNGATIENHGEYKYKSDPAAGVYDYGWKLPDFVTLEFIGIYIRSLGLWPLYPMLCLLDLETLVSSILWRYRTDQDVLNHMIVTEHSTRVLPTPISLLAKELIPKNKFNSNLKSYFDRVGLPEMYQLYCYKHN